jgi:hypothetical protein
MEFLNGIDAVAVAALTFLVIGSVELLKRLFAKDWLAAATIAVAAVVGGVFASQAGVTVFQGILIGLSASGLVTTVSRISGK